MEEILKLIQEFIDKKNAAKTWIAGQDWVQYAGPYFGTDEYTESVKTLLMVGWFLVKTEFDLNNYFRDMSERILVFLLIAVVVLILL